MKSIMHAFNRFTFVMNTCRLNFCSTCMNFSSLGMKVLKAARNWGEEGGWLVVEVLFFIVSY